MHPRPQTLASRSGRCMLDTTSITTSEWWACQPGVRVCSAAFTALHCRLPLLPLAAARRFSPSAPPPCAQLDGAAEEEVPGSPGCTRKWQMVAALSNLMAQDRCELLLFLDLDVMITDFRMALLDLLDRWGFKGATWG